MSGDQDKGAARRGRPPGERATAEQRLEALKLAHRPDRGPADVLATAAAYADYLATGKVPT